MTFVTKPIGPFKLRGTVVGLDIDGVKIGGHRLSHAEQAFVLQDITLERIANDSTT